MTICYGVGFYYLRQEQHVRIFIRNIKYAGRSYLYRTMLSFIVRRIRQERDLGVLSRVVARKGSAILRSFEHGQTFCNSSEVRRLEYRYAPTNLSTPGLSFYLLNMIDTVTKWEKMIFVHTGKRSSKPSRKRHRFPFER